jgi:hypothetical protein
VIIQSLVLKLHGHRQVARQNSLMDNCRGAIVLNCDDMNYSAVSSTLCPFVLSLSTVVIAGCPGRCRCSLQ